MHKSDEKSDEKSLFFHGKIEYIFFSCNLAKKLV